MLKKFNPHLSMSTPDRHIPITPQRIDGDEIISMVLTPELNISDLSKIAKFKIFTNRKTIIKKCEINLTMPNPNGDNNE